MRLEGGDCAALISVRLRRTASLSAASMCWKARLASLFCVAKNRPFNVSAILMGAFVSAASPTSSASVHGAGMLASSFSPPSANYSFLRQSRTGAWPCALCDTPHTTSCPSPTLQNPLSDLNSELPLGLLDHLCGVRRFSFAFPLSLATK